MHLSGRPVASFDPEGLIFAVGIESKMVKLYDLRSFDKVSYYLYGLLYGVHYLGSICNISCTARLCRV